MESSVRRMWISVLKMREAAVKSPERSLQRERWLFEALDAVGQAFRLVNFQVKVSKSRREENTSTTNSTSTSWQDARREVLEGIVDPKMCIACETNHACFTLPCTHQCLCRACWKSWEAQTCPFCKVPIEVVYCV